MHVVAVGIRIQPRYLRHWCKETRSCNRSSALIYTPSKILIGFAATAYLTLLLCVAYYLVDHERPSNPLDRPPNPLDRYCIDGFYGLFNKSTPSDNISSPSVKKFRPSEKWAEALEKAVLTFSDQQVITGIAILISGYSQLRGGLAVYYWQLVVDLAWFSSVTHLTTLTCLRYYFQERQGLAILRVICMVVMAGMLGCALATTRYLGNDNLSYDYPAWCLFHPALLDKATGGLLINHTEFNENLPLYFEGDDWTEYHNTVYVALILLYLFVSYSTRIVQLFPFGLDELRKTGHEKLSAFAQKWLLNYKKKALGNKFRTYWASVYTLTMAIYCIFKATADLYSSMLWEVCSPLAKSVWTVIILTT